MKREKVSLRLLRYTGKPVQGKREIPFEMRLLARLQLDTICFRYNQKKLEEAINQALLEKNEKDFKDLSERYRQFIWK